jgi:phosphoribosylformylglycinamidine synthase
MSAHIRHWYKKVSDTEEVCFNVAIDGALSPDEELRVRQMLADGFSPHTIEEKSHFGSQYAMVEIGPRLNFATAFSTNAVAIFNSVGLSQVTRVEQSIRTVLPEGKGVEAFVHENADKMTQMHYAKPLTSFEVSVHPEEVFDVHVLEEGSDAMRSINSELGLGMDDWDIDFYTKLFTEDLKRNPTNVECFQLGQANSEHSRHWFFKGKLVIDGENIDENLFEVVQAPYKAHPENSVIAFSDNSSAIKGGRVKVLQPKTVGSPSAMIKTSVTLDSTFTAETHNFPTGVAPFPGAETGSGGRIRDNQSTGRGAHVGAATAGYCVGNLNIPEYERSWEGEEEYPSTLATPLKIEIGASNGASDYGNKFGEPLIQGFTRSFGLRLPNGERREWLKPIMFAGGVGHMNHEHIEKGKPEVGMLIIQVGGPAYRIGVGGGAASSMIQGENKEELDFNAVQRGDAEMEQKMNRVVRACIELGNKNPIVSIHDQGAGGPCNVLTEIVEPTGGRVDVRKIHVGDKTMSVLEIWSAEAQERNALLIEKSRLAEFEAICKRENSLFEVLGEITGDGRIVLEDSEKKTTPVDLELEKILGKMPQKTFVDTTTTESLQPVDIPERVSVHDALKKVLRLLSVGSKRFLVTKVDRSVTGLIAQQQCVGPLQLPLADVSVIARSLEGNTGGTAISVGEQPIKTLVDPEAGARMSVAEGVTNMMFARISRLENVKCSANWMWAAKLPGESSNLYAAAVAMRNIMLGLGIAVDGGKDSLSMAAKVGDELVKSPGELTVSCYADMPDVTKVVTPDIKYAGESTLWFIDIAAGKERLGGSALAQVFKQIGNESPDVSDIELLKNTFNAVQEGIDKGIISAGHDRSDGGLITCVLEMLFAGNAGLRANVRTKNDMAFWFNEEVGVVLEIPHKEKDAFQTLLKKYSLQDVATSLGETILEKQVEIQNGDAVVLQEELLRLRSWWEETSHALNALQTNKEAAAQEKENTYDVQAPHYSVKKLGGDSKTYLWGTFRVNQKHPLVQLFNGSGIGRGAAHKVAIIREEGSNGDREMAAAFLEAGFEPWDVHMSDLEAGRVTLADFRGVAFVGGFSYADTLGSAKGWASKIRFNENLSKEFDAFYARKDTFSLGVCNGCQLMGLLGWVPWKGLSDEAQPRFVRNQSGRFESRWISVRIEKSPSIMLGGLAGSHLGAWVAHGEGRLEVPSDATMREIEMKKLVPVVYTDDTGNPTEKYPFNPNGSPMGIAGLCSKDGRHLAMMPHPERTFLKWQWPYMSEENNKEWSESPWLQMFKAAKDWCDKN